MSLQQPPKEKEPEEADLFSTLVNLPGKIQKQQPKPIPGMAMTSPMFKPLQAEPSGAPLPDPKPNNQTAPPIEPFPDSLLDFSLLDLDNSKMATSEAFGGGGNSGSPAPAPQSRPQPQVPPAFSNTQTFPCAYCSKPVKVNEGLMWTDYKILNICGCYIHIKCLGASQGDVSCMNCICQGCDQGGKYVQRGGVTEMLELQAYYPETKSACGHKWHKPCYERFTGLVGPKQEEGLKSCGYSRCLGCIYDAFAIDKGHPLLIGPNYLRNNADKELAMYRDGFLPPLERQPVRAVAKPAAAEPPKQAGTIPHVQTKLPAVLAPYTPPPLSSLRAAPPRSAAQPQNPAPAAEAPLTAKEKLRMGPIVPDNLVSPVPKVAPRTKSMGHRMFNSRLNLAQYINAGFTLEDFARHMTPSQFFKRFYNVEIIVNYLPENDDATTFGCQGQVLFGAWTPGVTAADIIDGIKGDLSFPPTEGQASNPATHTTIDDLIRLGVTVDNILKSGLTARHVAETKPVEAWPDIYPGLDVTKLPEWEQHHEVFLKAGLITPEQAVHAQSVMAQKGLLGKLMSVIPSPFPNYSLPVDQSAPGRAPQQQQQQTTTTASQVQKPAQGIVLTPAFEPTKPSAPFHSVVSPYLTPLNYHTPRPSEGSSSTPPPQQSASSIKLQRVGWGTLQFNLNPNTNAQ